MFVCFVIAAADLLITNEISHMGTCTITSLLQGRILELYHCIFSLLLRTSETLKCHI